MDRYLVFDAGCSICTELASAIHDATGGKLKALSIRDAEAKRLLDEAFPKGWEFAPYFVTADQRGVRAWTGLKATMRLGWIMGPRKAWRVWSLARRVGVPVMPGTKVSKGNLLSRRQIVKYAASVTAALSLGLIGKTASRAFATSCDCSEPRADYIGWTCDYCCDGQWHMVDQFILIDCGHFCGWLDICYCGIFCV